MKKAFILMIVLEGLSLLSFKFPAVALPLLIIIGLGTFFISLHRPEFGICVLFGELFVGSRGRLLEQGIISIRMVVFGAVFLAWLLRFVILRPPQAVEGSRTGQILPLHFVHGQDDKIGWRYSLLLIVVGLGIVNGIISGNGVMNVFQDANGYLFLLILPAVFSAIKNRESVKNLFEILAAAVIVIGAKTLVLFLWFTYGWRGVATLYHWVINRDIGEITGIVGSASRIFMQSQFWALLGLFIFSIPLLSSRGGDEIASSARGGLAKTTYYLVIPFAVISIIISLSRSFWLGGFIAAVFADLVLIFYLKVKLKRVMKWGFAVLGIGLLEVTLLLGITQLGGKGLSETVLSRGINPSQEAAGGARLLLLPELLKEIKESPWLGKGFGEEVTYKSYLPDRVAPDNPEGVITNFAFEWGYLDMLLKFGALGFVIYLLFVAYIFRIGWSNFQFPIFNFQTLGVLSGLVALAVLNITTPYLNHPLGIGYLILSYAAFRNYE